VSFYLSPTLFGDWTHGLIQKKLQNVNALLQWTIHRYMVYVNNVINFTYVYVIFTKLANYVALKCQMSLKRTIGYEIYHNFPFHGLQIHIYAKLWTIGMKIYHLPTLEPVLRLFNLQLQRQRCSRLERFSK
jgi:hypothetical protein